MFKLRPYQERAVEAIKTYFNNKSDMPSVLVSPTGSGKSLLIAQAAMLANSPVLVLQPTKELLIQNYNKYISYGLEASIYSSSLATKNIGKVTFATPMSIVKNTDALVKIGVKHIIIDECDLAYKRDSSIHKIIKALDADKVLGMTATPVVLRSSMVEGKSVLEFLTKNAQSFYRDVIHVVPIQEMIDNGFWSNVEYRIFKQDGKELKLNASGTDYTEKSLRAFYEKNKLSEQIKKMCTRLVNFNSVLIFVPSVEYAKELEAQLPDSKAVYGDLNQASRDMHISDFKKKKLRYLINVNVLGTGFDFEELDAIIHARPTGSVRIWYQHVGRLVRIHPNKKRAILIDLSGNTERFGMVSGFSFEKDIEAGWVMKSKGEVITDLPRAIKLRLKQEDEGLIQVEPQFSSGFEVLSFGSNKGKRFKDIPMGYILWLTGDKFEPKSQQTKLDKLHACQYIAALYKRPFFIKKTELPYENYAS